VIPSRHFLWVVGITVLVMLWLSACGRQPTATGRLPEATGAVQTSVESTPTVPAAGTGAPDTIAATLKETRVELFTPTPAISKTPATTVQPNVTGAMPMHPTLLADITKTPPHAPPDVFLIYGIRDGGDGTPTISSSPEAYQQDVIKAVTADLARRSEKGMDDVAVVVAEYLEVAVTAPCGAPTESERRPAGGGLALGVEVVLAVDGAEHRYIVVGALAHYCGTE